MDGILNGLNPAQSAAVTSPSKVVQILAPPGSGKTKTLTARVAYLISHNGLLPRNIIVCTFTVKAAKEMKERVRGLLDDGVASKLILGTFHSVARRYLCAFGDRIGLDSKFGIADSSDTMTLLRRITKSKHSSLEANVVKSRISKQKAQRISPDQYAALHRNLPNKERQVEQQEFVAIWNDYEEHLRVSNLLDYDDLLIRCVDLLTQHPSCVGNIEAVLIDEFQDTNSVQFELMHLFASANHAITTVGDPDQSIYGWRSADVGNLQKMRRMYPDTHVAKLEENYRSSGAILSTAQEVIEQDDSRPTKCLVPTHSIGLPPVLRKLDDAKKEADWLVTEIRRLLDLTAGILRYDDFAILLRSASLSRLIEASLGRKAMPYRTVGGLRFFDRVEVKLVLDYLRTISNPDHDDAMARILNVPARRLGSVTIEKLLTQADAVKKPLWHVVKNVAQNSLKNFQISDQAIKGLQQFVDVILKSQSKLRNPTEDRFSLADLVNFVLGKAKIENHLRASQPEEFETRWANIEELVAQAADTTIQIAAEMETIDETVNRNHEESVTSEGYHDDRDEFDDIQSREQARLGTPEEALSRFLANIALSTEVEKAADEAAQQSGGQITISTIHAAKGLEWPIVFVPAAYEGTIPHSRAEDTDEERRLLYVAMTRAQALLYLSCPIKDSRRNDTELSSFLTPRSMVPHFAQRGSRIGYEAVKEMAAILRRTCPSSRDIERARVKAEEVEDRFRVPGEEDQELVDLVSVEEHRNYSGYSNKRRRIDTSMNKHYPTSTTMMSQDAYSVSNTSIVPTFTTAAKVPLQLNLSSTNLKRTPGLKDPTIGEPPIKRSQSSLTGWINGRAATGRENMPATTYQTVDPAIPIGRASATHKRKPGAEPAAHPGPSLELVQRHDFSMPSRYTVSTSVASLHRTSIDVVRQQNTTTSALAPVRRAYGAKPSMNGWQARMARERN